MNERGKRCCAECGETKDAVDFRYTYNSRSYSDRCSACRNTPKIKCERCGEKQPLDCYGVKSSGERRRTCNTCLGHGNTPLSRQLVAVTALLDAADVGDKTLPIEERVKLLIYERNEARCMERKALRIAIPLMRERYERRRKNNTVRQMLESEDV